MTRQGGRGFPGGWFLRLAGPAIVVGLSVSLTVPAAAQQKTSTNAKTVRQWSLKSGPGAPHNILTPEERGQQTAVGLLRMSKLSADYVLGEGDRVDIKVIGADAFDDSLRSLTISNTGAISAPYLGTVQAAGLTAGQLEDKVAALLEEKKLLNKPQVLVYITDYQAKPIFITGQVDNPGEYMMSQDMTLMEGILMAGGIDPDADSFGYLHRRKSQGGPSPEPGRAFENPTVGGPEIEVMKIDLRPLKKGAVPNPDILLKKGDVLVIPQARFRQFYVIGDVKAPGPREIPPPAERAILVSQAIAQAGGPTRTAKLNKGMVIRYNEKDGSREELAVDFAAVLKGQQPDFEIRENDIVFIPGSRAKTVSYAALGMLPVAIQQKATETINMAK